MGDTGMRGCRLLAIGRVPLPPVTGYYEIQGPPSLPNMQGGQPTDSIEKARIAQLPSATKMVSAKQSRHPNLTLIPLTESC